MLSVLLLLWVVLAAVHLLSHANGAKRNGPLHGGKCQDTSLHLQQYLRPPEMRCLTIKLENIVDRAVKEGVLTTLSQIVLDYNELGSQ